MLGRSRPTATFGGGEPGPEACLTAKELEAFADMWRALRSVLFDESLPDVKALREEFFKRIPEGRLVPLMGRLDRYLAATGDAGGGERGRGEGSTSKG